MSVGKSISRERMYEVIRAPVITEKSTVISDHNQVAFTVAIGRVEDRNPGR